MLKTRVLLMASAMALAAGSAMAADGDPGATSTNQSAVSLDVPLVVKISDVGALRLVPTAGTMATDVALHQEDSICIYSNDTDTHKFKVTATQSGGTAFAVSSSGVEVPYVVTLAGTPLTYGQAVGFTGGSTSYTCADTVTKELKVTYTAVDVQKVPSDEYTATLLLMVEPGGAS